MEEILKAISKILLDDHHSKIDFKTPLVAGNGEKIDGIELVHYCGRPDISVLWCDGNCTPLKDYDEDTIKHIFNRVKKYKRKARPLPTKTLIKTKIDFKLDDKGECSQYCFNDFNEQEHLNYNDTLNEVELVRVLEKLVLDKIIKPKKCKGIIRDDKEGTLFLKFRYYSKRSNLLEKEVHKRTLTFYEWK